MERSGADPSQPFYLYIPQYFIDGTLDLPNADGQSSHQTIEEAIASAVEGCVEHGEEGTVFHCVPVRRIERGKPRVINLEAPIAKSSKRKVKA